MSIVLAVLLVLVGSVLLGYRDILPMSYAVAGPLLLFAVNLIAAILTQPAFRAQSSLMVFHVALLAVVVLAAASRLTYLQGGAEVTVGRSFDGNLAVVEAGPLHPDHFRQLSFVNEGFEVHFDAERRRGKTYNRVRWVDHGGRLNRATIGDNTPLVLDGYRFHPSPNNGFAGVFEWTPAAAPGAAPVRGAVNFPAYPLLELQQANEWTLPDGETKVWAKLEINEEDFDWERPLILSPPEQHTMIVRFGDQRLEIRAGQTIRFEAGALRYLGLTQWMGYVVHYDPFSPWLLAASLVTTVSLGWHLYVKFNRGSWQVRS